MRQLRLRMSDETVRSVMVDENQPVANLMVIICTKLGITDHDEYSLIATGSKTINGRRRERNDGRIVDQKMEQLKKKLKTDEDLAWVDHSKTLDEQEIHEQDIVLLRRRFFYSDQNVDSRDPLQLGLLFLQTRDAILSGTHPVTIDGACKFAGIQCQAQLGNFMEGKTTRPGYFQLKDYLPADYAKTKHIERKIWAEHKKYNGVGELEAKAMYVSEARSLPTYGVTFFLVKEKVPGKSKLVPRLLGITKDCVMRVDADTKGILKTWPLTTVKRWAPSMNSFTLDFGDYSDSYYSVQTSEGEQISQLIAGYIDIIQKRRKAKDHFGIEGDEGATMIEDSVAPSRATIIQNQPALARPPSAAPSLVDLSSIPGPAVQKTNLKSGPQVEPPSYRPAVEVKGKAEIGYESRPVTQYVTNYELTLPQRDLQDRLEQAQDSIEVAQKVLDKQRGEIDRSRYERREVEQKKHKLSNQFAEINAATAELVSLSAIPEEELNYPALNSAVETVANNLPAVAKEVRIVASLMDDEESGERLIDAARRLCEAFSDLLNAAEPGPTVPRQSLISAASRVGDATQALLYSINNGQDENERDTADTLLGLAKSVASSAASLVLKAKDVARTCNNEVLQNQVICSATQCALATSQMIATAKIVTPTIHDPSCQRKLIDSCREVQRAVKGIRVACREAMRAGYNQEESAESLESTISCILRDLETTIMFAEAGSSQTTKTTTTTTTTTRTDQEDDNYLYQRKQVPKYVTVQVEDSHQNQQQLNRPSSSGGQQRLGVSQESIYTMNRSSETMKEPAEEENSESFIKSVKDVAVSLSDLIGTTNSSRLASNSSSNNNSNHEARNLNIHRSEESTVGNNGPTTAANSSSTTTTTTTTKTTLQHSRTLQEREEEIQQQQQQRLHEQELSDLPEATISGIVGDLETTIMFATAGTLRAQDDQDSYLYHRENVLRCAKALVEDTRPLVASVATNHQQLAQIAQESVYTMSRLAETVKESAASLGPNNSGSQVSLIRSVKDVAVSLSDLIGSTKSALGCDSNDPRLLQVKDSAKTMVTSVTSLLKTVESVEDEQQQQGMSASIELLGAASSIDAAAKKLENLKPRVTSVKLPHEDLNFDEIILDAAKCIIEATAALLRAASASQRELIVDGRLDETETFYASDNNQWSEGLVSAAKMVAAATHSLVEAANALVQGQASEERLISAAKQVASSTNQLLVACKVKADPDSRTMTRLSDAGNQVKRATDNLVRAAQQAIEHDEEQSLIISNKKVSGIAQEISAREQILRKEKELQVAKTQLMAIRKAKYSNRPDDYQGYGGSLG